MVLGVIYKVVVNTGDVTLPKTGCKICATIQGLYKENLLLCVVCKLALLGESNFDASNFPPHVSDLAKPRIVG